MVSSTKAFLAFLRCKMEFVIATMLFGSLAQIKFLVILVIGVFLLIALQRTLKLYFCITETCIHLFCLLIRYHNVMAELNLEKYEQLDWEVIENFKIIAFSWVCKGNFFNNHAIFISGIAETQYDSILKKVWIR